MASPEIDEVWRGWIDRKVAQSARAKHKRWWPLLAFIAALLLLYALIFATAHAAPSSPSQCGPTSVGTAAVAMTFPASGQNGPSAPQQYLSIGNPSATATLWVNPMPGGTAAPNTAGSFQIGPGAAPLTWSLPNYPPPAALSIVASASSSPVTCAYY